MPPRSLAFLERASFELGHCVSLVTFLQEGPQPWSDEEGLEPEKDEDRIELGLFPYLQETCRHPAHRRRRIRMCAGWTGKIDDGRCTGRGFLRLSVAGTPRAG